MSINFALGKGLCPDKNTSEVTLYQSILHTKETLQQFTGEAFYAAILDSGACKTVCGKNMVKML